MKKVLAVILCLVLAAVVLAGCGSAPAATETTAAAVTTAAATTAAATTAAATTAAAPADDSVKTGLAVISSVEKSTPAGDKDGLAETDSTIAAVTVDKDGKIVKCVIDAAQSKINFSKAGKLTTDLKTVFKSKQELKEEYGLGKASKIGKEWYQQADAFAAYVVGKTVDEVKGIAVNDQGTAADAELSASVTIHIGDFINVVQKAVANAQDFGAKAGDKLGLGVTTNMSMSTDAAADKPGVAQAYSTYTAATFGADGAVTSCVIDASQCNVNFDTTGKITNDLKAALQTKDELGEGYGLKKASKIGKEWNEQAAAFAKYVNGKTVDQIKGIAVDNQGVPTDAELTSSVTIHIGDFTALIEKAANSAK